MNCQYKMMRQTRGSDLKLGMELVHEVSCKTRANLEVFQLEGGTRKKGRGWRRSEGEEHTGDEWMQGREEKVGEGGKEGRG